jgi:ABC-type transporter Mla subunit MlaD
MADPPRYPDTETHTTPRWVKVFGIIALIVVLLFVVMLFAPGSHGPGRHMRGTTTPPAEQDAQP